MEDGFVAAQRGSITLRQTHIDVLLRCVDLLNRIANTPETQISQWSAEKQTEADGVLMALAAALSGGGETDPVPEVTPEQVATLLAEARPATVADERDNEERVLRVTADNLNRLLGLAGESLVESRWLKPFAQLLLRLKRQQEDAGKTLGGLREALSDEGLSGRSQAALADAEHRVQECYQLLSQRLVEMEMFDSRSTNLAHRLYDSALACRMRPFADGTRHFPRMVRDLGRTLGKQARLEIIGEGTQVDRDILEKLDAPLGHLLRNALDHGLESTEERLAAGKPAEGVVRLEARHSAGLLQIAVSDDGRGMDLDRLRSAIVERKLTTTEIAQKLSEAELLEFLFLPGFTTKNVVTDISGRGVGLDVVQNMIKQVRGTIRVISQPGKGARFQLQLPLTLSVVRTLLVEIGGEPYAFPLAHIVRTLKLPKQNIELLEGREHFNFNGQSVGLVSAQQLFGGTPGLDGDELSVIVVGDPANTYGLVMDRFLGERELVVQPLDTRLGKIRDVAAGALMADGSPVLIVDIDDLLRSMEKLVAAGRLNKVEHSVGNAHGRQRKRVLVVEDSLTVRELERKLLDHAGYEVEVAVDGMDGWNAARVGHFSLIITDIDMPRMDGIELVKLIRKDPNLKSLPVMVVSYKDREEDRHRGLDAGADYYLTKGSFQDDTLLRAVVDLIGAAAA
jgi:two-component system sensor histidine kinase and response regulator WspE